VSRPGRLAVAIGVAALVSGALAVSAATTSPRLPSATPAEIPVSFRSGANTLTGILSLPAGNGPHAAVVLLSGSERGGADTPAYVLHARTLASSGVAVLRYDPPGVGGSTGSHLFETLDDRAHEAIAAVDFLRSRPELRPDAVGVWGVSQGGLVTQMAASASTSVAFAVSVSGSGVTSAEQQAYSVEAQSRAAGFSRTDVARAVLFSRLLVDWQITRPIYRAQNLAEAKRLGPGPWKAFATLVYAPGPLTPAQNVKRGIAILTSIQRDLWARYLYLDTLLLPALKAIPPGQITAVKAAMQRSLLLQPKTYLSAVHCPVLAVWGADDVVVPARKSASVFRQYLKAAGNPDVTIVVFAHADHSINGFEAAYWKTLTSWLAHRFAA
jgi:pimeloyl-ACP methyl ester carboxylesterase